MTDAPTKPPQEKAKNAGWSVYDAHKKWARREATRLSKEYGRPVSESEAVRIFLNPFVKGGVRQ